ncbi:hypothetical protein V1517DRAFT_356194 [Lipomyces orientalis]|uniref:Uncharacterized protein n=1 Tax=Lipomyces orientalis TaxID=1233043 RepID=A0ACC3TVY6_9ASCO
MEGDQEPVTVSFPFDLMESTDLGELNQLDSDSVVGSVSEASSSGVSKQLTTTESEGAVGIAVCQGLPPDNQQAQVEWDAVRKDSRLDLSADNEAPPPTASITATNDVSLSARQSLDKSTVSSDVEKNPIQFSMTAAATSDGSATAAPHGEDSRQIREQLVGAVLEFPSTNDWQAQALRDAPDFAVEPEDEFDVLPDEVQFDDAQILEDQQVQNPFEFDSAYREDNFESQQSLSDGQQRLPLHDGFSQNMAAGRLQYLPNSASTNAFYRKAKGSNGKEITLRARSRFLFNTLREGNSGDKYKRSNYGVDIEKILLSIEKEDREKSLRRLLKEPEQVDELLDNNRELWVEKWRARKWIDLIGDERTHRTLLRWLQQWSHAVFKKPVPAAPKRRHFEESNSSSLVHTDPYHRPQKKLLLLHGAPGLGKTTVAHVAARQAGYDILEINASDERGGPLVQEKIRGAIDSHRVGARPVCIIIDEIDGAADSGFIRVLLDILNADSKAIQQGRRTSTNNTKNKNKKAARFLLRPIIAICNDPFVSTLRVLRPLAEMISYRRALTPHIVSRLKEICAREKISVDSRTLTELVDSMDGDVRGCVNTLQFDMGTNRVGSGNIGRKDVNANPNVIVSRVFKIDKRAKSKSESIRAVIENVERSAEFDKVTTGCFTVYPTIQYADEMLAKPVEACEWLHFYDTLSHSMYHDQHFELSAYLPYPIAAFHSMFSSNSNSLKEYAIGKTDYEAYESQKSNKDLAKQMIGSASASTQQSFRKESTISTELAPYLMYIINPKLNPVNATIVLEQERQMTMHTVDVMIDFAMKYIQQRADNGAYVFRMDPPIEQLALFSTQDKDRAAVGKYLVRQSISHEMEREILRRARQRSASAAASQISGVKRRKSRGLDGDREDCEVQADEDDADLLHEAKRKNSMLNHPGLLSSSPLSDRRVVNLIAPAREKATRPSFISFFKPQTSAVSTGSAEPTGHSRQNSMQEWRDLVKQERQGRVWVQFHEGFSNAVRKPVSWSDFWRDL